MTLEDKISLNIGGQVFMTTRKTLCSRPSKFAKELEQLETTTGTLFIDRDPHHFNVILNYMRTGKILLDSNADETSLREIELEAEYYQLHDIVDHCRGVAKQKATSKSVIYSSFSASNIIRLIPWLFKFLSYYIYKRYGTEQTRRLLKLMLVKLNKTLRINKEIVLSMAYETMKRLRR